MDRYAYVNGNPISYIDPFGLSFSAEAIPYLGALKGFKETITGVNYITGEHLSVGDRIANGLDTLTTLLPILGRNMLGHNVILDVVRS